MANKEYHQMIRRPSKMEENNINSPYTAVEQLFICFNIVECRKFLWKLYQGWVLTSTREHIDREDASDMLPFYTLSEMLMKGAWLLNNKRENQRNEKSKSH